MNWLLQVLSHPIALLFALIIVGDWISKIKVSGISLGVSAILIVSIIVGAVLSSQFQSSDIQWYMKSLSSLGTAMFMAVIGISAGQAITDGIGRKKSKYFFIGVLMVIMSYFSMQLISKLDRSIEFSVLYGVFCGAMTSTPGLSSLCELSEMSSEAAVLGYGCAYLFGVVSVVLYVQWISKKAVSLYIVDMPKSETEKESSKSKNVLFLVALTIVLGHWLGDRKLPFSFVSLGSSGGILCMGMLIGWISHKIRSFSNSDNRALELYRGLGLRLFFVGCGIPAGVQLVTSFHIKWFLYGIILSGIALLCGTVLCKWIFRMRTEDAAIAIAGGMTSTPALGVLQENKKIKVDYSVYSMAYIGALITMVIIVRF